MKPDRPRLTVARVRSQRETAPGFFSLELDFPPDFPDVLPGQYLNLRAGTQVDPLFRRPFGVVEFRREPGATVVELYYAVVGRGTSAMALWRAGDPVDSLGPLGTPYDVDPSRPAILVAGGRGAAPLLFLHRMLRDQGHADVRFAFGARTESLLFGIDRLDPARLLIATDDGTRGFHGTVVEALERERPEWLVDAPALYACGPERFLHAAARLAERRELACQVSLEAIYGCGLGLCRGCAVPLRGESRYLMQCAEGPVVDASRVDWERYAHE
jgi:dihydroorotate dehydrogenase electron transfer subunit